MWLIVVDKNGLRCEILTHKFKSFEKIYFLKNWKFNNDFFQLISTWYYFACDLMQYMIYNCIFKKNTKEEQWLGVDFTR